MLLHSDLSVTGIKRTAGDSCGDGSGEGLFLCSTKRLMAM